MKEMIKYLIPLLPGALYMAFQGQISIFLIAGFGHIQEIAKVGALGRLGQLFVLLTTSNSVLLAPYIAKTPRQKLPKRYLVAASVVCAVALILCLMGIYLPDLFLFILGPQYHGLHVEVALTIAASSISYLSTGLWAMNSSRKWVFWWTGMAQVGMVLGTQLACIFIFPLSTASGILWMGVCVNAASLLVQVAMGVVGLREANTPAQA